VHGENWYRGTADAVTQNLDIIRRYKAEYVVILAGDPYLQARLLAHVDRSRRKRGALHRGLYAGAH
jgi:ADP-glucose pyrophosphorylase